MQVFQLPAFYHYTQGSFWHQTVHQKILVIFFRDLESLKYAVGGLSIRRPHFLSALLLLLKYFLLQH